MTRERAPRNARTRGARRTRLLVPTLLAGLVAAAAGAQGYGYGQGGGQGMGRYPTSPYPGGYPGGALPVPGYGGPVPGQFGAYPGSVQGGVPQPGYSTIPGWPAPQAGVPIPGLPFPLPRGGGLMGPMREPPAWLGMPGVPSAESRPVARLASDRFLAARFSDLVEVRPGEEKAYFPLLFWRKVMELGPDSSVRSSAGAHLLFVFSDGTRIEHFGRCHIHVREIQEARLSLALDESTTLRVAGGSRLARLLLPEGTTVEVRGGQANIETIDDRLLLVRNFATEPLTLSSERGVVTLRINERCVLPLVRNEHPRPPFLAAPEGQELVEYGSGNDAVRTGARARMEVQGRVLEVEARGEAAAVRWGGAAFRVQPGARLVLDPMLGERFPLPAPTPASRQAPAGRDEPPRASDGGKR